MSWNNLSIKDKALYIKLGVSSGIHDLDTIRDTYNNVYADGGYALSLEDVGFLQYGYGGNLFDDGGPKLIPFNYSVNYRGLNLISEDGTQVLDPSTLIWVDSNTNQYYNDNTQKRPFLGTQEAADRYGYVHYSNIPDSELTPSIKEVDFEYTMTPEQKAKLEAKKQAEAIWNQPEIYTGKEFMGSDVSNRLWENNLFRKTTLERIDDFHNKLNRALTPIEILNYKNLALRTAGIAAGMAGLGIGAGYAAPVLGSALEYPTTVGKFIGDMALGTAVDLLPTTWGGEALSETISKYANKGLGTTGTWAEPVVGLAANSFNPAFMTSPLLGNYLTKGVIAGTNYAEQFLKNTAKLAKKTYRKAYRQFTGTNRLYELLYKEGHKMPEISYTDVLTPIIKREYTKLGMSYSPYTVNLLKRLPPTTQESILKEAQALLGFSDSLMAWAILHQSMVPEATEYKYALDRLSSYLKSLLKNSGYKYLEDTGLIIPTAFSTAVNKDLPVNYLNIKTGQHVLGSIPQVNNLFTPKNLEVYTVNPAASQDKGFKVLPLNKHTNILFSNEPLLPHATITNPASSSMGQKAVNVHQNAIFDNLQKAAKDNIEQIEKDFPGVVTFGSTVPVSLGNLVHEPHDLEIYVTPEQFSKYFEGKVSMKNESTYGYNHKGMPVDVNVIKVDSQGRGNNRAVQLFRQYFPEDYLFLVKLMAPLNASLKHNIKLAKKSGELLTENDLLLAAKTYLLVASIIDSREADFVSNPTRKLKHAQRIIQMIALGKNQDIINRALEMYMKSSFGPKTRMLPQLTFGTEEQNIAILKSIGFPDGTFVREVAKDPQKMQNALLFWASGNENTLGRAVNAGDMNESAGTLDKLMRNLTYWNTGDQGKSGGMASGWGLNAVTGGRSDAMMRSFNGLILPKVHGLYEGMSAKDAVLVLLHAAGVNPTMLSTEELSVINLLGKKYGIDTSTIRDAQDLISGKIYDSDLTKVRSFLQEVSDRLGINSVTNSAYDNRFSGIIRKLLPEVDAIGVHMGDIGKTGAYIGGPGFNDYMSNVMSSKGLPSYSIFEKLYPQEWHPAHIELLRDLERKHGVKSFGLTLLTKPLLYFQSAVRREYSKLIEELNKRIKQGATDSWKKVKKIASRKP